MVAAELGLNVGEELCTGKESVWFHEDRQGRRAVGRNRIVEIAARRGGRDPADWFERPCCSDTAWSSRKVSSNQPPWNQSLPDWVSRIGREPPRERREDALGAWQRTSSGVADLFGFVADRLHQVTITFVIFADQVGKVSG